MEGGLTLVLSNTLKTLQGDVGVFFHDSHRPLFEFEDSLNMLFLPMSEGIELDCS